MDRECEEALAQIFENISKHSMVMTVRHDGRTHALRIEIRSSTFKDSLMIDLDSDSIRHMLRKLANCQLCVIEITKETADGSAQATGTDVPDLATATV